MKVCILCPGWPGRINRWNGIFIQEQAHNLSKLGLDISIVSARIFKEDPSFVKEKENIKIYRFSFPSKGKLLAEYERIPVIRMAIYLISALVKSLKVIRKERCDIIHAHWAIPMGLVAIIAGKYFLKKPVILTAHDSDITTFPKKSKIADKLINFTLNRADLIISVSETLKGIIIDSLNVNPKKIKTIPMGVNRTLFTPLEQKKAREALNLPQNQKIILFIGALLEIKGIGVLKEAINKIISAYKDAMFILVGSGPFQDDLKKFIEQSKVKEKVSIRGPKPRKEIPLWLAAADILVLPSLSEGLPTVLCEALAMQTPVIASKVGAIPELLEDGENGLLTKPGDSKDFVYKINKVFDDNKLLSRLRQNAKLKAEYDTNLTAIKIRQIYDRVAGRGD